MEKWKDIKGYGSMEEAARQLNIVCAGNIRGCIIGRTKSCAGYKWEYIEKVGRKNVS